MCSVQYNKFTTRNQCVRIRMWSTGRLWTILLFHKPEWLREKYCNRLKFWKWLKFVLHAFIRLSGRLPLEQSLRMSFSNHHGSIVVIVVVLVAIATHFVCSLQQQKHQYHTPISCENVLSWRQTFISIYLFLQWNEKNKRAGVQNGWQNEQLFWPCQLTPNWG